MAIHQVILYKESNLQRQNLPHVNRKRDDSVARSDSGYRCITSLGSERNQSCNAARDSRGSVVIISSDLYSWPKGTRDSKTFVGLNPPPLDSQNPTFGIKLPIERTTSLPVDRGYPLPCLLHRTSVLQMQRAPSWQSAPPRAQHGLEEKQIEK